VKFKIVNVSKKARKKRLQLFTAPLHERQKLVGTHLSKDLRAKIKKRSLPVRKGDKVKVLRGKFKKKEGKVISVDLKKARVFVEGCVLKKQGGKEVLAPIHASNLLLIELTKRTPKLKKHASTHGAVQSAAADTGVKA
jgi:large subunit ribosomal protein L24